MNGDATYKGSRLQPKLDPSRTNVRLKAKMTRRSVNTRNNAFIHVQPRRIWLFIYEQRELRIEEQRHLNACMDCAEAFRLCVNSETWEDALSQITGTAGKAGA
jgi:hypothetical protein